MAPAHRDPNHNHAIITDLEERVTNLEERLENATTASVMAALEERLAAIEEQLSSNRPGPRLRANTTRRRTDA